MVTEHEEKRLKTIRDKMAQMKAQEQAIIANDKKRQRKERTRRLIQLGALVEKYLDCPGIEPLEFEKVLRELTRRQS